jgi:hypothetical protein
MAFCDNGRLETFKHYLINRLVMVIISIPAAPE